MKLARSAALLMGLFVLLGAFGAHGLKQRISAEMLTVYQTGIFYHGIHAVALFAVAWLEVKAGDRWIRFAGRLVMTGIGLFSGSLYAMAITGIKGFGMITPLGGLCFIAAWVLVAVSLSRPIRDKSSAG